MRYLKTAFVALTLAGCNLDGTLPNQEPPDLMALPDLTPAPDLTPPPDLAPSACTNLTAMVNHEVVAGRGQFGPRSPLLAVSGNTIAASWMSEKGCGVVKTYGSDGKPLTQTTPECIYGGDYPINITGYGVDQFIVSSMHYDNTGKAIYRLTIFSQKGKVIAANPVRVDNIVDGEPIGLYFDSKKANQIDLVDIHADATLAAAGQFVFPGNGFGITLMGAVKFNGQIIAGFNAQNVGQGFPIQLFAFDPLTKTARKFDTNLGPCQQVPMIGCVGPYQAMRLFPGPTTLTAWVKNTKGKDQSSVTVYNTTLKPISTTVLPGDIEGIVPVRGGYAATASTFNEAPNAGIDLRVYDAYGKTLNTERLEKDTITGNVQMVATPDGHVALMYSPFNPVANIDLPHRLMFLACQ
ncbi:MAG: hypothetical protein EXS55_01580 [Candidatus Magasanikbacteria bacterium]|nr:hypothetical protein [Candidatus Magasanikbacteria bacterium]